MSQSRRVPGEDASLPASGERSKPAGLPLAHPCWRSSGVPFIDSPIRPCYIRCGVEMSSAETLELYLSKDQIAEAVKRLARQIETDYPKEMPLMVGILKGSFIFMSDLTREIQRDMEMDFIRVSSYGGGSVSSGRVKLHMGVASPVKGRNALIVEDIVDTGLTTSYAVRYLRRKGALSVRVCALLDKPSRRTTPIAPDYVGCTTPDRFLVGYGLDYDERYRSLADIYVLSGDGNGP